MEIQPIINKLASTSTEAYQTGRTTLLWMGHTIKKTYVLYAGPTIEKLSTLAMIAFNHSKQLLRTQPGAVFALAGGLLFVGVTAFKIADRKAYEDDRFARTAWKTAGIATFVAATALTSVGMFAALV